ncbi:PAS domain-containing hybrid sensor histidine kinase/response regulator [Vibrio methylphosphonaticus]|uniref:PAS domain-containing hybrid sensor histidine kinase/response regulator n=1 Tax=Vibrio methylphosphonaticus TaxID=2946866 RepID=UPI00202A1B79|nr:PAS domain-containing hybrid sensor histidine kinase/response regulator [Vibrio methylphosphonaticus]MCL9773852.1 ATP-binding protein [Vibrio methylphosphonaticus]
MSNRLLTKQRVDFLYLLAISLSCGGLITNAVSMYISESYQKSYLSLSQSMTHRLDEIYAFEYSSTDSYDVFSSELVELEVISERLYDNIKNNSQSYPSFLSPIPKEGLDYALQIKDDLRAFTQRLERLLSAKVSMEYSTNAIKTLETTLKTNTYSNQDKLAIFQYLDSTSKLGAEGAEMPKLQGASQYRELQTLKGYLILNDRVKNTIKLETQSLIDSEIHRLTDTTNSYWLEQTLSTQVKMTIASMLLLFFVGCYLYRKQQIQQYRERQLNTDLLTKEKERSHLAMVVEHASDAIIITDKEGKTTWVNAAFERISGYQFHEIAGKKPGTVLQGEETAHSEVSRISEELKQGNTVKSELVNYHKDGQPYWIDIVITPILNAQHEIEQFIAVERDSSERKKLLQSLELAVEKADASNQAKSTFLATMSHELRTPLNGIMGMAQILESSITNVQHRQQLHILLESGNHLLSLLNDILDISKIEEGKLELEVLDFSIEDICDPIVSTYSSLCKEKGIEFELVNQLPKGKSYKGDKSRIRQIIFNLLSNSVKFTSAGDVKITLTHLDSTKPQHETLVIRIEDTGIGIPSDKLDSIFSPFVQAESSTTRQFGGTGLGLAIVKQLTNLMSGDVTVKSTIGKGSTFSVTLELIPIKNIQTTHDKAVSLDDQAIACSLNILLVEDNKVNALVTKTFCTKQGHQVEVAQNGEIAVDCVKNNTYDLIIMDNHMPVMDGIEATSIIRQQLKCNTVIFGCTADVFKEAHDNFMTAGANHILTKPLQKESFIDALQRFRHQLMTPSQNHSHANILQLIRHDTTKLESISTTEAEITLNSESNLDNAIDINRIIKFKHLTETSLDELVQVYTEKGIPEVLITLTSLQANISDLKLHLVESKLDSLLTQLNSGQQPNIHDMQSLINLVEVNIHQAIRIIEQCRSAEESHSTQPAPLEKKHFDG